MVLTPPFTRPHTEACVRCDHAPNFHRLSCHHLLTWQHLWRRCSCQGYGRRERHQKTRRPGSKSGIYRVEDPRSRRAVLLARWQAAAP